MRWEDSRATKVSNIRFQAEERDGEMKGLVKQNPLAALFIFTPYILFGFLLSVASISEATNQNRQAKRDIREAIVKIYTVTSEPNYYSPWKMRSTESISGSGCIISGKRILTNAHVIANHTFIQVRRHGQSRRYKARVVGVAHDADVALLTVDDSQFFKHVTPLKFGELPLTQQDVVVYGFPFGGDALSTTKGVISRIEHQRYAHSGQNLLAGQIDAAINSGNSGGPVVVNGRVAGIVMQAHNPRQAENMGHMVPTPILHHVLRDLDDGQYQGFPSLGLVTQALENPSMKRKYNLPSTQTGVVVQDVSPRLSVTHDIQVGDVLIDIDGYPIEDDGTIEFRPGERTSYTYIIEQHQIGDSIPVELIRGGSTHQLTLSLAQTQQDYELVLMEQYDQQPLYFIYGGIVFSPLTMNLLKCWGRDWPKDAPRELLNALAQRPTDKRREVVVALQVLPADINVGYHHMRNWIVADVNGEAVTHFQAFFQQVVTSTAPFIVFRSPKKLEIVIDRKQAEASHDHILQRYRIPTDHSPFHSLRRRPSHS